MSESTAWHGRNKRQHQQDLEAAKRQWTATRYSRTFGPLRVEIETSGTGIWEASIWAGEQIVESTSFRDRIVEHGVELGLSHAQAWAHRWIGSILSGGDAVETRDVNARDAHLVLDPSEVG